MRSLELALHYCFNAPSPPPLPRPPSGLLLGHSPGPQGDGEDLLQPPTLGRGQAAPTDSSTGALWGIHRKQGGQLEGAFQGGQEAGGEG